MEWFVSWPMIFCVDKGNLFPKGAFRIERYHFDFWTPDECRKFLGHKGLYGCFRGRPLVSAATEFEQHIWLEIGSRLIFGETCRILKQDALTVRVAFVHESGPPGCSQDRVAGFLESRKHLGLNECGTGSGEFIAQFLAFVSREAFNGKIKTAQALTDAIPPSLPED